MTRKRLSSSAVGVTADEALAALDAHLDKWRRVIAYRDRLRDERVRSERPPAFRKAQEDPKRDALDARLREVFARSWPLEAARHRAAEAQFALDFHTLWLKPKRRPIDALDRLIANYGDIQERVAISGSRRSRAERGIYFAVSHLERAIKDLRALTVPPDELRPSRQYEVRDTARARQMVALMRALDAPGDLPAGIEDPLLTNAIPDLGGAVMQMHVVAHALTANEAVTPKAEEEPHEHSYLDQADELFGWLAEHVADEETVNHPQGPQFAAFVVLRVWLTERHGVPVVTPPLGDPTTIRDWFTAGRAEASTPQR